VDQHNDVEGQIVADGIQRKQLEKDQQCDRTPDRRKARVDKSGDHSQHIRDRVDDRIAKVCQLAGVAIPLDDKRRVLEDLPAHLRNERENKTGTKRQMRREYRQQPIKDKTVNNVREGVPVKQVLGALDIRRTMPDLHGSALANHRLTHQPERETANNDNAYDEHVPDWLWHSRTPPLNYNHHDIHTLFTFIFLFHYSFSIIHRCYDSITLSTSYLISRFHSILRYYVVS